MFKPRPGDPADEALILTLRDVMEVELIRISAAIVDGDKVNHCGSLIFCDHKGESFERSFTCNNSSYKKEVTLKHQPSSL